METDEQNFSPQDSLLLIQSMINKTRANISDNRFHFLLWGWMVLIGSIGQYILKVVLEYRHHYLVWLITFVGLGISFLYIRKKQRRRLARTYIDDSMRYLWTGMGISFGVISFVFSTMKMGWLYCYPIFILMYGLGTFVSGKILQFRPLVIGGIINWVLAVVSAYFDFDTQMLFAAAAILTSYIIPGYLLKSSGSN